MISFSNKRENMISAWQQAEKDLGIVIQTPFMLKEHSE